MKFESFKSKETSEKPRSSYDLGEDMRGQAERINALLDDIELGESHDKESAGWEGLSKMSWEEHVAEMEESDSGKRRHSSIEGFDSVGMELGSDPEGTHPSLTESGNSNASLNQLNANRQENENDVLEPNEDEKEVDDVQNKIADLKAKLDKLF